MSRAALLGSSDEAEAGWLRIAALAAECRAAALPLQVVHGDISPVNLIFNGAAFTLIDWDCVHLGLRWYDAIGDVLNRPPVELASIVDFQTGELESYLRGYRKTSKVALCREELRCTGLFGIARQLEDLRQRLAALDGLTPEEDGEYAALIAGRIRMLRQIMTREAALRRLV